MQDSLAFSPQLSISSFQLLHVFFFDILFEYDRIPEIKSCSNKVYLVTLVNHILDNFLKICNVRLPKISKSEVCIWVEKTLLKF